MAKHTNPAPATDEQVRALLERYKCPVPFHEVRTRFLGNVATPVMSASPIKTVKDLWGGDLPAFDSIDPANDLIGALIMGLWNRLTRYQDRNAPFRVMRVEIAPTRQGLAALALMRGQELDGFVDGLFGGEEAVDLPERAHRGVKNLGEMRALFSAVLHVATDETSLNPPCRSAVRRAHGDQSLAQLRPTPPAGGVAHRDCDGLLLPDQHDHPITLRAGADRLAARVSPDTAAAGKTRPGDSRLSLVRGSSPCTPTT
jgi:hypothetical protein